MRVLFINSVCGIGSTGRICTDTATDLESQGHEVKIAYGRGVVPENHIKYAVRIGNDLDIYLSGIHSRITDRHGFSNKRATKEFLEWADQYNPDLLWLHNLHGYYINIEMLFEWIKSRPNMQVKWTLHDCWAFTGHCSYFSMANCDKWKYHCEKCIQKRTYPSSYIKDDSYKNYEKKRAIFTQVKNMTLITPSYWLAGLIKDSFFKEYPIDVIHNTIDTNIFKPTESDFRKKNNLENKKVILGVANIWSKRKGLDDFYKLSEYLDDSFVIILVGVSKKQMKSLPQQIIGIAKTNSAQELAAIYSASDVFVNLTYEDNYPTVNLEARACGIPVLTYNTGGSVESVLPENIIEQGNVKQVYERIKKVLQNQ